MNWKISKNEKYINIYDTKLFVSNYFSECSGVLLKINFVINELKVYLVKFFLLNIHEVTSLLNLRNISVTNLLRIFIFFCENCWPYLNSCSKFRESVRHGDITFWFSENVYTGCNWNFIIVIYWFI